MYDYLCRHGYVNEHNAKMIQLGLNRVKSFLFDLAYTVIIGGLLQIPFEALCMELSYIALRSYSGGFHASTPKKCKYYSVIWTMAVILMLLHLYSFGYALAVAVFMCALMGVLGMWSEKRGKTDR